MTLQQLRTRFWNYRCRAIDAGFTPAQFKARLLELVNYRTPKGWTRAASTVAAEVDPQPCTRCDGQGIRNDRAHWVDVEGRGNICFRCKGSGTEPGGQL